MTTKLDGVLKRELSIGGEPYTLTLSEDGFTLTLKGHRKGLDIRWADLVGGDAALATALNASLTANIVPRDKSARTEPRPKAARSEPRTKPRKPETHGNAAKLGPRGIAKPGPLGKAAKPKARRSSG